MPEQFVKRDGILEWGFAISQGLVYIGKILALTVCAGVESPDRI